MCLPEQGPTITTVTQAPEYPTHTHGCYEAHIDADFRSL